MKLIIFSICLVLLLGLFHNAYSQKKCGMLENTEKLKSLKIIKESDEQFELWMNHKLSEYKGNESGRTKEESYKVPVVFHVIHNGEPIGTGTNIPDAQIYSQLEVLNEDFQRRNEDAVNTPTEFIPVAGSTHIEFVLARRDPSGEFTTGINRVRGTQVSWTSADEFQFKSLSYWPAEDYLNIWVCNLTDFLGLAQYPVSDLPGLEDAPNSRETDGIVLNYQVVGSVDDGNFDLEPQYNKGRTVIHEMGHFLGLRHIWGDVSGCDGTDFVDDTPPQDGETAGCPKHPRTECNPPNAIMFQNFMDFTDDSCMNLFTSGQVSRMKIVLQNSPRRKSLQTSPGLLFPGPSENDLALLKTPPLTPCTDEATPILKIKNAGTNTINTVEIQLSLQGNIIETKNFSITLEPMDSTSVTFNTLSAVNEIAPLDFQIISVNGADDANFLNNSQQTKIVFNNATDRIPLRQNFEQPFEETWTIVNPSTGMNWDTIATNYGRSLYFNAFNNFTLEDQSWLISPLLDFSDASEAHILYDVSYARRQSLNDILRVLISPGCQPSYQEVTNNLRDVGRSNASWIPRAPNDWRTEFIDLSAYVGLEDIRIALVAVNGSGNNIYIDNIEIFVGRDPRNISIDPLYSIFGYSPNSSFTSLKIGFNLGARQNVKCEIFNTTGQLVSIVEWLDVLNQVFDLPLSENTSAGAYVIRLQIDGRYSSRLVFKSR